MILAVDFDGTCVDHRYPDIGPDAPGAVEWLKRFQELGAKLILWTMRSPGHGLEEAVEYLTTNGITLYGVNENPEQRGWTSSPKAYANRYIDDAAVGCPLIKPAGFARPCVDWTIVGPKVESYLLDK